MTDTNGYCTTTESVLPPCRICGEKASGFHYGVNTCEACKVSKYSFYQSLSREKDISRDIYL